MHCTNPDRCNCSISPQEHHTVNCYVCGDPLQYFPENRTKTCYFCGKEHSANASCESGHFVCDSCHSSDATAVIRELCVQSRETDPVAMFERIRSHPSFSTHGPEHHGLVPGVLVAAYRNLHGGITDDTIRAAIDRGAKVAGGSCGFTGACGAAQGVGAAFVAILGATPLSPPLRRISMKVTSEVLGHLASFDAARCCNRDCLMALHKARELSLTFLPKPFEKVSSPVCRQMSKNKECIRGECPWWPRRKNS